MSQHVAPPSAQRRLFKAADGAELIGTIYRPATSPRAIVILNGATGVPQGYYRAFAEWAAAQQGLAVFTYDYRDTALSARGHMRHAQADMLDWGITDQQAARVAARALCPDTPIWIIGHSLGAMLLASQTGFEGVTRITGVASGMVHVSDHPWPYRAVAFSFWHVLGPPLTAIAGYLPGKRTGFGADLPAPAYWQWRRWCTSRDFYARDLGDRLAPPKWSDADPPVRLLAFEDDDLIPPHCVEKLSGTYASGRVEVVRISPAAHGLRKIGHLGAFARANAALWPELLGDK